MKTGCRFCAIILLVGLCLLLSFQISLAERLRVVFFAPTSTNNTYWPQVDRVLQSVAGDLNIDLVTYEFDIADRFAKAIDGVKILRASPKPDGAILSVAFGQTRPLLEAAEELGIPVFIQGPLFPEELPEIGHRPREKFKNWIGYFLQDEQVKGYILAAKLLQAAHKANAYAPDGLIHVIGVGGDHTWFGSRLRQNGLLKAVSEDHRAVVDQVVPTRWSSREAARVTETLLKRYPEASVVWAASDQLAIGAAEALEVSGRILGRTGFVGGLDLSATGLAYVQKNKMIATVASLLVSYGEILVYLYDYLKGLDFSEEIGREIRLTPYVATPANADQHLALMSSFETIDFSRLSRVFNPELSRYDFSLQRLLSMVNEQTVPDSVSTNQISGEDSYGVLSRE